MTIREKRTPISQFAAALRQRSPQEKRDLLVADTLDSLCRHCDLYDAARVSSNPFHPELLRTIAAADLSSEALFSLFECLAVLVHLRKLAHPGIPLDAAEEDDSWRNNRGDKSGITRDEPGHTGKTLCNFIAWDENGKGGRSLPFFVSAKQVTGRYWSAFFCPSMRRFTSAWVAVSTTLA